MRYKAAPLSVRNAPPPVTPFHTSRSFRLFLVAIVIPVILIPLVIANASGVITLSPNEALPGTTIEVSGQGFPANVRGELEFDGDATAMPTFRTDHDGAMTVSLTIPDGERHGHRSVVVGPECRHRRRVAVELELPADVRRKPLAGDLDRGAGQGLVGRERDDAARVGDHERDEDHRDDDGDEEQPERPARVEWRDGWGSVPNGKRGGLVAHRLTSERGGTLVEGQGAAGPTRDAGTSWVAGGRDR